MAFVEHREHVTGRRGEEHGRAHRGVADFAMLSFAALLVLAEFAWLSFLVYVLGQAVA